MKNSNHFEKGCFLRAYCFWGKFTVEDFGGEFAITLIT